MIRDLLESPADRRLLGLKPLSGPTPWLVAIMSFSILIIAAAGLAIANSAGLFARSVEARYSIEVPNGSARLPALLAALQADGDVMNVSSVSETAMRADLKRWLGSFADNKDLPVPALVNFDLKPGGNLGKVRARVTAVEPSAAIEAHETAVGPILSSLRTLQWVALALVLLLAGAAAAAIVLAARAALDTHRATIEILHGIGATDEQITSLFQRKIAADAVVGSLAGAFAAGIILLMLAAGSAFLGELTGGASLSGADLFALAVLPFVLTALATLVSRRAVLARLRQTL
jgi:cell division transport system permease protein